jgi:hypothetical protein
MNTVVKDFDYLIYRDDWIDPPAKLFHKARRVVMIRFANRFAPLALRKRFASQARLKKIEPAQIDAVPMTRVWLFSLFVSIKVAGFIIERSLQIESASTSGVG